MDKHEYDRICEEAYKRYSRYLELGSSPISRKEDDFEYWVAVVAQEYKNEVR